MDFVYYEVGGEAGVELFAAPGTSTGFDSSFRLVGDTANGGLATLSAVPEPSSIVILGIGALGLLPSLRRRLARRRRLV